MQILINDQPLDITVERDDTLGEVVRELKAWLKGSDLVLYSIRHRDRELLASPPEEWESTSHTEVDALEVTVRGARELQSENLDTIVQYLELLAAALADRHDEKLAELAPGFAAMVESVSQFEPREVTLHSLSLLLAELSGLPVAEWPAERLAQAQALVERLHAVMDRHRREVEDPRAVARELTGELASLRDEAQEVSVLLQTGRDRQAMETIIRFSELSQSLARVLHCLADSDGKRPSVGGRELREFYTELNGFLSELVEAFSAQDTVLIGDLMEYEVAPRLEELRSALEAIL